MSSGIDTVQPFSASGVGSPAVGGQNNFDIATLLAAGFGAGRLGILSFSGAATTLTGIQRPSVADANNNNDADQPYSVIFLSHPNGCTLTADSASSSTGNKIAAGGPAVVKQAILAYDYTVSKWRVLASLGAASTGIVNADVATGAEIAVAKLANGTADQILKTDGTDVAWGKLVDANVDAAAAIVLAKLAQGTQAGVSTLVAGTVTVATATITANSRIFIQRKTAGGVTTLTIEYSALGADRVVGAPGTFVITSRLADGTFNNADESVVDWLVIN